MIFDQNVNTSYHPFTNSLFLGRHIEIKSITYHNDTHRRGCRPRRTVEYEGSISQNFRKVSKRSQSYF